MGNYLLKYFTYDHLPEHLQAVSKPFCELAEHIGLRSANSFSMATPGSLLLEAKDCAVRSVLG